MSRSNKGARKDIQLLRKLKAGDVNPSALLNEGSAILDKANKIKGFLKQQRQRTEATSGKSEWLLTHQQLNQEREDAERELQSYLAQIQSTVSLGMYTEATDALAECRMVTDECKQLRTDLKLQVKGISQVHGSIKAYGASECKTEVAMLKQELSVLKEDIQLQLQQLNEQYETINHDIQQCWPSAMGPNPSNGMPMLSPGMPRLSTSGNPAEDDQGGSTAGQAGQDRAGPSGRASDTAELEEMLGRYPIASEEVKSRIRIVYAALHERFLERMAAWRADYEATMGSVGPTSSTGGWSPEEHSQYLKLREKYFREVLGAKGGRETALAKVAKLLPGRTTAEVMAHDDWYWATRQLQRRQRDVLEAWGRERTQFLADSECVMRENEELAVAAAAAAAQKLAHELVREQTHAELEALRAARQAEWEAGAEARAEAEQRAAEQRAAEELRTQQERAIKKEMIAAYRDDLERQATEAAELSAAAAREMAALQAEQALYNRERVEWRHAEYAWKVDKKQEAARAKEAEEAEQQARLDRLRALVAPQVEADPARVLLPTAAFMAVDERPGPEENAFRPVHGYTVKQLYKDPKFKIMDALQRQGLHNTDYGRRVINLAQTARPTRPDNLTTYQRGGAQTGL